MATSAEGTSRVYLQAICPKPNGWPAKAPDLRALLSIGDPRTCDVLPDEDLGILNEFGEYRCRAACNTLPACTLNAAPAFGSARRQAMAST